MNNLFIAVSVVILSVISLHLLNNNDSLLGWRSRQSSLIADLLVTNGTIYTSDSSLPFADSMAIGDGRILRIGNFSSVKDLAGAGTKMLNLAGKVVVPGFIDSHVHLIFGGLQMTRIELQGVNTKDAFVQKVKEAVIGVKDGSWLLGGGWNNDLWGGELPVASWIDDITIHHPLWLSRMDGHMGLANSLALRIAGVVDSTMDPPGGVIIRNHDGEATGLLLDSAMKLVLSCIPEVSVEERREAFNRASRLALSRGVTTIVDFGRYFPSAPVELPWVDFSDVYKWADLSGRMMIRLCLFFPMATWSRLADIVHMTGRKLSKWIYLGGVKAFADGSLGSHSALFHEAYVDEPQNCGLLVTDIESLYNLTVQADNFGLQVAIHAIGDKANDLVLDMYRSVVSANGKRDRRFRIEHAQHLVSGNVARFGEEGIIASVQPDHLLDDADSAIKKLGLERAQRGSYLFQSLLANNALLAFGSDWPVVDINPLGSIQTAVKRIPPGWDTAWISSECMKLTDALNACQFVWDGEIVYRENIICCKCGCLEAFLSDRYTISAARACFLDEDLGSLSPGKMADFVVLKSHSWDDFMAEKSSVAATYVGGVQAYP